MKSEPSPRQEARQLRLILLTALIAAVAAIGVLLLFTNILERRQEARNPFYRVVELTDDTEDPAVWGKNFPLQYDDYLRTVDQIRTRYGGSEAMPRRPTQADPRSVVTQSRLEEDPRLRTLWAGYAFAVDFREERGHAYMLEDQTYTERQNVAQQPGTCLHCDASVYTAYKRLGNGNLTRGFERINQMPYSEARQLVTHPVACIDCHEPSTMQLRITRPAFLEAMRQRKQAEGIADYDVNTMASRQEMRSFVCGLRQLGQSRRLPDRALGISLPIGSAFRPPVQCFRGRRLGQLSPGSGELLGLCLGHDHNSGSSAYV